MKNRRGFLAALSAASGTVLVLGAAAKSAAQTCGVASPGAAAAVTPKAPSAAALAVAASFRAFDPTLSDDEVRRIAVTIDSNRAGSALNPKKRPLRNGDDMAVRFAADETMRL